MAAVYQGLHAADLDAVDLDAANLNAAGSNLLSVTVQSKALEEGEEFSTF